MVSAEVSDAKFASSTDDSDLCMFTDILVKLSAVASSLLLAAPISDLTSEVIAIAQSITDRAFVAPNCDDTSTSPICFKDAVSVV